MPKIALKRVYDPAKPSDGFRVLVDRLWPRGLAKAKARFDLWAKEVAPTATLRRAFNHRPEKFAEFRRRYRLELAGNPALAALRKAIVGKSQVTLLFGAHDPRFNQAVVLAEYLKGQKSGKGKRRSARSLKRKRPRNAADQ